MATINIICYRTRITRDRNMIVEDIIDYLNECESHGAALDLNYQRPAMDIDIVMPWSQLYSWAPSSNSYVKLVVNSKSYYYFVTKAEWASVDAVRLFLHLDTLNTYWEDINTHFTAQTHITRQHKDRFLPNKCRIIDRYEEGISPVLYPSSRTEIEQSHSYHWYLVYKTDTTAEDSAVSCYCCADQEIPVIQGQSAATVRWNANQFSSGYYYYLISEDDLADPEIAVQYGANPYTHVAASYSKPIIKMYLSGGYVYVKRYSRGGVADTGYPYEQALSWVDFIKSRRMYYSTNNTVQLNDILQMSSTVIQSGSIGDLNLADIDSVSKVDPLLIKIIELPYSPFDIEFTGTCIDVPTGWEYDENNGMFKLDSLSQDLESGVYTHRPSWKFTAQLYGTYTYFDTPFKQHESKLMNSNFYGWYYVYDDRVWTVKPELLIPDRVSAGGSTQPGFKVSFRASNDINSNCAFHFGYDKGSWTTSSYQYDDNFPGYLVCGRDNEVAIYTSEYLNYLKYGKSYADRQTATSITSTWLSSMLSIAGGAASGFMVAQAPGAIAGAVIGAMAGIANSITSTVKTIDAQQQKEWEMQYSSTNISGNNDRNLFNWYSDGHLWCIEKKPSDAMYDMLYQLFSRGGYACNDTGVPKFNTRLLWNFIQCTPAFDGTAINIYQNYLDDIIERFKAGVVIFHHANGHWDFDYQYENWETNVARPIRNISVSQTDDTFTITGRLDNYVTGDYIAINWDWDGGADETLLTPAADGTFSTTRTVVDCENILARIVNTGFYGPQLTIWSNN